MNIDDFMKYVVSIPPYIGTIKNPYTWKKESTIYIFSETLNFYYGSTDKDNLKQQIGYPKFQHKLKKYED